ncbi:acetoacetate--CoA ligase [Candidatus Poriferisodalis sp.]|uniref:acetoacetate--CoA ligase n=1 Tax=Candidatus Poriferisodalis sp. TaxID=3101277 RepID=UPI003B02231D
MSRSTDRHDPASPPGGAVLWQPDDKRRRSTQLWRFASQVGLGLDRHSYQDLHEWSVSQPGAFWRAVWDFSDGIGELGKDFVARSSQRGHAVVPRPGLGFFAGSSLNIAEHYLRSPTAGGPPLDGTALVFIGEDAVESTMTYGELRAEVAACQRALSADGVGVGDRVATMLPNGPAALIVFLAAASLGAVYSSVSPDFGIDGVLDRFGQIAPTVLVAVDGYYYNGIRHRTSAKAAEVASGLASSGTALRRLVLAPYDLRADIVGSDFDTAGIDPSRVTGWSTWLEPFRTATGDDLIFERGDFDQPVCILYSSGTTGKPKCIVHRAGGALLKLWSEQRLHFDVRPGDRVLYFTTTGWMMWNWLVAGLAAGASLVLYDGSPFHPGPDRLFDVADRWGVTLFGVSAKFIEGAMKAGIAPAETHGLDTVRAIASTGSPLAPEGFDWVYSQVKSDVHLASFSGGTDICGGFVIGDPTGPVRRGEIQVPALGLDVDVADSSGGSLGAGAQGELVCRNVFVSMPLQFWSDPGDERYRAAYFDRYPGIWHHGDFAEWTPGGGIIISGRSDATLNPGGVRIGTAEIYRQVDRIDEVLESVVIGQRVAAGEGSTASADTRVVLFVKLRDGLTLDGELIGRIRAQIRSGASPRHVPAVIAQVPAIPRTRSGKLVELAVRDVVEGRPVANVEAIDDPDALSHFADHPALALG